MAEDKPAKTPLEKFKDLISVLKEMEHYSRSNIEKLTEHWMFLEDEMKHKEFPRMPRVLDPRQAGASACTSSGAAL